MTRGAATVGLLGTKACGVGDAAAGSPARAPDAVSAPLVALRGLPSAPRRAAPRLSVPQQYRACAPDDTAALGAPGGCPRAPAGDAANAPPGLAVVVAAARARADASVDADALHALALADLAWSDAAGNSLDGAISTLRTAARLSARPSPALADLAAALLVRADQRGEARDLFEAADVALLALDSDSAFAPARFNLALALGRIGLVDVTVRAWAAFLAVEPRGPWADEARRRAVAVAASAVRRPFDPRAVDLAAEAARSPQEARLYGWEQALGRWGAAVLAGDTAAAGRELAWARVVGRALEARGGDATLADAVRVIEEGTPRGSQVRTILAQAHRGYAAGRVAFRARNYAGAEQVLRQAGARAPSGPSRPLRAWANAEAAAAVLQQGGNVTAERMGARLIAGVEATRHPALAARALWVRAIALQRAGRSEESLPLVRRAAALFERAGEWEHVGVVRLLAADVDRTAGDAAATHRGLHRSLTVLRRHGGSVWLHNVLYLWAQSAAEEFPRVAARVQDEDIGAAAATWALGSVVEARLARAQLAAAAGHVERAESELQQAAGALEKLPYGPDQDWLRANRRLVEATVAVRRGDVPRAARTLDTVVAGHRRGGSPARLVPALVARADARVALGDARGTQADLDEAFAVVRRIHDRTESARLRAAMMESVRRTSDRLVMRRVAQGRVADALRYMQQARAAFAPVGGRPAPAERSVTEPGNVGLQIALIGDTLLVWTVAAGRVDLARSTVPRAALIGTVERVRAALEAGTGDARPDLARLYDFILRPVRPRLQGARRLMVAADGEVAVLPFAALYDRTSGEYLVERHAVLFTPRLGGGHVPRRGPAPRHALLVADPAFDPSASPGLARLTGARAEVGAIASLYPAPHTLGGSAADRTRVLAALAAVDVAHYAGHAVFDDLRPDQSYLLLASAPGAAPARVTAAEIDSLPLGRLRLVVLSACETGRPVPGRSGGFAGLTGAFLAAGVEGVLGSLWRVQDDPTRWLMVDFHRHYRSHGDGAGALRRAQLTALRSPDPARRAPAAWAGFRYTAR